MLGKVKSKRLPVTYDNLRCHFFLLSAGYRYIVYTFRKNHNLLNVSKREREDKIGYSYMGLNPDIFENIYKISNDFKLPPIFVEKSMMYDIADTEVNTFMKFWSLPIRIATSGHELKEGFYIEISPHSSKEVIEEARKYLLEEYKFLNKYHDPNAKKIHVFIKDKQPKDIRKKIIIFVSIEDYLYNRFIRSDYKFNKHMITDAILDASEDKDVKNVTSNIEDEKLIGYITNVYRSMQRTYEIPSFTSFIKISL